MRGSDVHFGKMAQEAMCSGDGRKKRTEQGVQRGIGQLVQGRGLTPEDPQDQGAGTRVE